MLVFGVLHKLVLSVVANAARVAHVRFLVCVATLVVVAIADSGEALGAVLAFIRFFASVDPHMDEQVASLVKPLLAVAALEVYRGAARHTLLGIATLEVVN